MPAGRHAVRPLCVRPSTRDAIRQDIERDKDGFNDDPASLRRYPVAALKATLRF